MKEDRGQKTEDRGQKTEDRGQRTEDRGQRTEDRGSPNRNPAMIIQSAKDLIVYKKAYDVSMRIFR
jgi:hypothetical protein